MFFSYRLTNFHTAKADCYADQLKATVWAFLFTNLIEFGIFHFDHNLVYFVRK